MKTMCLSDARPPLAGAAEKIAPTAVSLSSVRLHGVIQEHAPVHPLKVEPSLGFAVSVTDIPVAKLALHAEPQLIPDGLLVTVPPPVPVFWIVISIDNGEVTLVPWSEPQPARKVERRATERRRETTSA